MLSTIGIYKYGFHKDKISKNILFLLVNLKEYKNIKITIKNINSFFITEMSLSKSKKIYIHSNGIALDKKQSLIKASLEFIERYMSSTKNNFNNKKIKLLGQKNSFGLDINSNGISIGQNKTEAAVFGLMEIIERDTFLNHWYLKKIPKKLAFNKNFLRNKYYKYLYDNGYSIEIYNLQNEFKLKIVWVLIKAKNTSAVFSTYTTTGCSFTLDKALNSALSEAFYGISKYTNKKDIHNIGNYALIHGASFMSDHPCIYSLDKNKKRFDYLDNSILYDYSMFENNIKKIDLNLWFNNIYEYFMKKEWNLKISYMKHPLLNKFGFYVCRVSSSDLQPLIFGQDSLKHINKNRLKEISSLLPNSFYLHPYT